MWGKGSLKDGMMGGKEFFKKLVSVNIGDLGRCETRVGGGGNTEAQTTQWMEVGDGRDCSLSRSSRRGAGGKVLE